jgi:ATP-dependent DNA helicase RecG
VRSDHADRRLAAFVVESRQRGEVLGWRDLLVLSALRREKRITSSRAGELLQESADDARMILNGLVERGLLESRGEARARTYHLAARVRGAADLCQLSGAQASRLLRSMRDRGELALQGERRAARYVLPGTT